MSPAFVATTPSERAGLSFAQDYDDRAPSLYGFIGVLAVIAFAPFEATRPLLRLPGQSISSLEAVLLAALGLWAWAAAWSRSRPVWRTPLTWPGLALLAALAAAAIASPWDRMNAVHMVGRLTLAAGLYVLTVSVVTNPSRARTLMLVACATGAAAAALVALDFTRAPLGQAVLAPFRTQTATVGAQVRASGSFQYPTIASMFLEIAFACGLGLLPLAVVQRRTSDAAILMGGLLITAAGIILTYTRAGLVTMALSLVTAAAFQMRRGGFDRSVAWLAGLAAAVVLMVPLSRSAEAVRLRFMTEGQEGWYSARIDAPARITMVTGSRVDVPITLTNTGGVTWDSSAPQPFGFSYHWLLADSDRIVSWEGIRSMFSGPVAPGDEVEVMAHLEAPRQPGEYRVVWDLYQEHLLWFSTEPDADLTTSSASVNGVWSGPPLDPASLPPMPGRVTRPTRGVLWTAAVRMLAERPWLGVGPDNFRLHYAPYAKLSSSDPRVHTNNMYLELLVGGGLLAGIGLVWFGWQLLAVFVALARRVMDDELTAVASGAIAAVMAIAAHGLVDSFLSFTATYAVMAISVGLVVASSRMVYAHAHRV